MTARPARPFLLLPLAQARKATPLAVQPGEDLAKRFQALPGNRWELRLRKPVAALAKGRLTVSVKDRQGNRTQIERSLSIIP